MNKLSLISFILVIIIIMLGCFFIGIPITIVAIILGIIAIVKS